MKVDAADFRRVYEGMNDTALLAVKREELVEVAQQCYDAEIAKRGLAEAEDAPEQEPGPAITEEAGGDEEMVTVATFEYPDEAKLSRALLESADIPCALRDRHDAALNWSLTNAFGELRLTVPASYEVEAREVLESQISDDDLAAQAEAAGEPEEDEDQIEQE